MSKNPFSYHQKKLQELLRRIRVGSELSQAILAERMDRPQSFVSKYESGERRLDVIELREVCQALEISFVDFVRRFEESIS